MTCFLLCGILIYLTVTWLLCYVCLLDLCEYCQAGAVSHMHINLCCCVGAVKFSEGDHRVGLISSQHASKTLTVNFLPVEDDGDGDDDDEDE